MAQRVALVVVTVFLLWPGSARAQGAEISITYCETCFCLFDSEHVQCRTELPPMIPRTLYILSRMDYVVSGVHGAEFSVRGMPPSGLLLIAEPNPAANVVVGNLFADETADEGSRGGVNIAFPQCQLPDGNGVVLLFTVNAVNTGDVSNVRLWIDRRDPPSNPTASFPLLNSCDGPFFTQIHALGGELRINDRVSVESEAWSRVKQMYR